MYIKIDDEFADSEFSYLAELLDVLDEKIMKINYLIKTSPDPESEGVTDRGEYFIGVGFAVIQQYMVDTYTQTGFKKNQALKLGPKFCHDMTFANAVNSAANWWKHYAEWKGESLQNRHAQHTIKNVSKITDSFDYTLSNVLAKIVGSSDITLSALLPNLVLWRLAVDAYRNKKQMGRSLDRYESRE